MISYVSAYRRRQREQARTQAELLHRQTALIGQMLSPKIKIPALWDAFPSLWTQEERAELTQRAELAQLKAALLSLTPTKTQEG